MQSSGIHVVLCPGVPHVSNLLCGEPFLSVWFELDSYLLFSVPSSCIGRNGWFLYTSSRLLSHVCQPCHMPQSLLFQAEEFQPVQSFVVHLLSRLHRCNSFDQNRYLENQHENLYSKQIKRKKTISTCGRFLLWTHDMGRDMHVQLMWKSDQRDRQCQYLKCKDNIEKEAIFFSAVSRSLRNSKEFVPKTWQSCP